MKVVLTEHAKLKMGYYVNQCEDEISGLGKVELVSENGEEYLIVDDLEIFEQTVSAAHSTIPDEALAKFTFEMTKKGEDLSKWRLWWHSHAKMSVFFSGTDTSTIDKSTEFPWMLSLVTNHAGDMKARFDLYDPIRVTKDNLDIITIPRQDLELKEKCKKEIQEKVSTRVTVGYNKKESPYWDKNYRKNETREKIKDGIESSMEETRRGKKWWNRLSKAERAEAIQNHIEEEEIQKYGEGEVLSKKEEKHEVLLIGKGKGKYSRH